MPHGKYVKTVQAFQLGLKGHHTPVPEWFGALEDPTYEIGDEGVWIDVGKREPEIALWGDWIVNDPENQYFKVVRRTDFARYYQLIE